MENTNKKYDNYLLKGLIMPINEIYDLNELYIGIYEIKGEFRVGLFRKTTVEESNMYHPTYTCAQYYQDILTNNIVALWLTKNKDDIKCSYETSESKEQRTWEGVRGTVSIIDAQMANLPKVDGEIDRCTKLNKFISVFPNEKESISFSKMFEYLLIYCAKFNLYTNAKKEIIDGLSYVYIAKKTTNSEINFINKIELSNNNKIKKYI